MAENKHLSFASSLCGACTSVCPVKIPIHNLLLKNRQQSVEEGLSEKEESRAIKLWMRAMLSRTLFNLLPMRAKNWVLMRLLSQVGWSKRREPLLVADTSFNKLWRQGKRP
jgi:L-lactate dehydrogenase complex protein LldF